MRKVVIVSGISGSGKTYHATGLIEAHGHERSYLTSGNHLDEYIRICQGTLRPDITLIVIDRPCLLVEDMTVYRDIARAYGLHVELVTMKCEPQAAYSRTLSELSSFNIHLQHALLMKRNVGPWWNCSAVSATFPPDSKYSVGGYLRYPERM